MNLQTRKAYDIIRNRIKEKIEISTLSEYEIFQKIRLDIMLGKEKVLFIQFENIVNALNEFEEKYLAEKNLDVFKRKKKEFP